MTALNHSPTPPGEGQARGSNLPASTVLTQNLPLLAGAPNGIKKLRELILELAVRGKLVPQDPSDEPASELLKRIAAEKARLVAEGKIKKSKSEEYDPVELAYSIPTTWAVACLGQVVEIVRGITFPASEKSRTPEPGRVACLRTANVQDEIEWDDLLFIRESFVSRADQYVRPHDIVMSMANSRELVGKVAIIGAELAQKTSFGGFLGVLRPVFIEPRFIMALLRTPNARSALIDSSSQTTNIANVSLAKLRPLPFAIPPLAEQHRIVAKVDELMALCDRLEAQQADAESAHAQLVQALLDSLTQSSDADEFAANWQRLAAHFHTLFTTESSIDVLKQTLLQLAVMGKLVPQDPSDEPTSESLSRISDEKTKLLIEGKLRKEKQLLPLDDVPFALPINWSWSRLGRLISDLRYGTSTKCDYSGDGTPVLRIPNIGDPSILLDDLKYGDLSSDEMDALKLFPGDLLMIRSNGSASLVGKTAVVTESVSHCAFAGYLIRLRLLRSCINSYYLQLAMKSLDVRHSIESPIRTTSGVKNINSTEVSNIRIPLPPLAEQHRIVAKVDQLMTLCDRLKARLTQARQLNEQLASTLVEQAVA